MTPYDNKKILIGLSGGINSMAVLCWLVEISAKPLELHLFYAHFIEHSPDTLDFVRAGIEYAKQHFDTVKESMTWNSIMEFFRKENMIAHPMVSPCSRKLKIEVMERYCFENGIDIDMIGYVKEEIKRRTKRQQELLNTSMFETEKQYPIGEFTNEWCFEIVDRNLGWHPRIYDIRDENGNRVFLHNNCLPCKNMTVENMEAVKKYYPEYHAKAMALSKELDRYWGRDEAKFYTTFGRDLGQDITCNNCKW